jgi:hypothetical protein
VFADVLPKLFGQFGPREWVFADHCGQCGVGLHGFAKGVFGGGGGFLRGWHRAIRTRRGWEPSEKSTLFQCFGESQAIVLGPFIRELISFGNTHDPTSQRFLNLGLENWSKCLWEGDRGKHAPSEVDPSSQLCLASRRSRRPGSRIRLVAARTPRLRSCLLKRGTVKPLVVVTFAAFRALAGERRLKSCLFNDPCD